MRCTMLASATAPLQQRASFRLWKPDAAEGGKKHILKKRLSNHIEATDHESQCLRQSCRRHAWREQFPPGNCEIVRSQLWRTTEGSGG